MAIETEIKLSLSSRAASGFSEHPLLAGIEPKRQWLINTYYDTPDKRLRQQRIVLRHRRRGSEWLLTVKTAATVSGGLAQRSEWEVPSRPGLFDFSQVGDPAVRGQLEAVRDDLVPIFNTRFRRCSWLLALPGGGQAELALDRGRIEAGGRRERICEVELELRYGELHELFDLALALQDSVPLHPEAGSKSERAYRLLATAPLQVVKTLPVSIDAGMSAVAAFRKVALLCLNHLQSNEQGVLASDSPEFVHQARVAIRRLRSAIRLWEPLLPPWFVARYDPLWQGLATKLGDTRNWDIFSAETLPDLARLVPPECRAERLFAVARRRCAASRRTTKSAMRSSDYSRLLLECTAAVMALPEEDGRAIGDYVPLCLDKRLKRVEARASAALLADVAARHRLRVAFKQLRYALEFFAPILAGPTLQAYHLMATQLQETLGRLNDLAVAKQLLAELSPGAKGQALQDSLSAQSEALLPDLGQVLQGFRVLARPWPPVGDKTQSASAA